ncbi:hypothetical protein ACFSL4_30185 [Streptomyces caeni]|uniref:Uncharacterized protein n=1 Tax=Streptomyces caeni TaxID=2307231 RepID=A0ABW4J0B5_9ACTN
MTTTQRYHRLRDGAVRYTDPQAAALTSHMAELGHAIAELTFTESADAWMAPPHCGCGTPSNTSAFPYELGTDQAVVYAFERIVTGTPEHTSSALTVSTLCAEAGIPRATCYRSPLAEIITGLLRTPDAPRPQTDTLAADIARLKKADRMLPLPARGRAAGGTRHHRRLRQPQPDAEPAERRTRSVERHLARSSPPGRHRGLPP